MYKMKVIREGDFFILYWEGELWKRVDKGLTINGLKGLEKVEALEEAEELLAQQQEKKGRALAVFWLSKRGLFTSEIKQKLENKGFSSLAIMQTLVFCEKIGAINDAKLAEEWLAKELRKGRGSILAFYKIKRWVDAESLLLDEGKIREAEKEAVRLYLQKKRVDLALLEGRSGWKIRGQLLSSLLKRGFKRESIEDVLQEKR
jgi:SOS response regulatory protein OraA/RecX